MTVEYTAELTEKVRSRYVEAVESGADYTARSAVVKELAKELNTSVPSVRGKLSSLGVYVAKETAKTSEGDSFSKTDYIKALEAITGENLPSFDKATKRDVKAVFDYIRLASDQRNAELGQ